MECCICKETMTVGIRCSMCTSVMVCAPCFVKIQPDTYPASHKCPVCQTRLFAPNAIDRPMTVMTADRLVTAIGADKAIVLAKDVMLEPDIETKLMRLCDRMNTHTLGAVESFRKPPSWTEDDDEDDDDDEGVSSSTWVENYIFIVHNALMDNMDMRCAEFALPPNDPVVEHYIEAMRNIKAPFDGSTTTTVQRRHMVIERLVAVARMFNKDNAKYSKMHYT